MCRYGSSVRLFGLCKRTCGGMKPSDADDELVVVSDAVVVDCSDKTIRGTDAVADSFIQLQLYYDWIFHDIHVGGTALCSGDCSDRRLDLDGTAYQGT